ncbi:hypothetical protein JCM10135_04630 [Stetteria hydrogenophila]
MPVPKGTAELIVTAKPGKTSWAIEEVADTLIPLDPEAEVSRTPYEGVILARAKTSVAEAVRAFKRFEYAFIAFITPVLVRCVNPSPGDVAEAVRLVLRRHPEGPGSVLVRVKLRGRSKRVASEREVREILAALGFSVARRGPRRILVVEGVDDYVGVSFGNTWQCGVKCTLVDLSEVTII